MDVFLRAYGFGLLEPYFQWRCFYGIFPRMVLTGRRHCHFNNLSTNIDYKAAMTLAFCSHCLWTNRCGLAARSNRERLWSVGLFSNAFYLWGVVELTLLTVIVTVPFLQHLFGNGTFEPWYLLCLAPSPSNCFAEEARKILCPSSIAQSKILELISFPFLLPPFSQ